MIAHTFEPSAQTQSKPNLGDRLQADASDSIERRIKRLLTHAVNAPSGDNSQPWRFIWHPQEQALAITIDEDRVDSPKAMWRFIARLSCGAAVENIMRAAPLEGVFAQETDPIDAEIGRISLRSQDAPAVADDREGERDAKLIDRRMTNRSVYDGSIIRPETVELLRSLMPQPNGFKTFVICEPERIRALARPMFELDTGMYSIKMIWKSIEARIRFDRPLREAVSVGLSQGSLGLSKLRLWAMRAACGLPHGVLQRLGLVRAFSRRTIQLVGKSSGLLYIVSKHDDDATDYRGGRVLQQAWLELARAGFATHPMNTIALMEHVLDHGEPEVRAELERVRIRHCVRSFRELVPEAEGHRSVFLLRFGHAAPPLVHNGRLPVEEVVTGLETETAT